VARSGDLGPAAEPASKLDADAHETLGAGNGRKNCRQEGYQRRRASPKKRRARARTMPPRPPPKKAGKNQPKKSAGVRQEKVRDEKLQAIKPIGLGQAK
jgi:hypothetical protein